MSRPLKKSGIDNETRKKWLRQREEDGDTYVAIAKRYGYDPRTVRTHVELAQRDRERHETRQVILRDAMQEHFRDLTRMVERIDLAITNGEPTSPLLSDRLYRALEQHLSRASLWKYLGKWDTLCHQIETARADLRKKLHTDLVKNKNLKEAFGNGEPLFDEIVEFFSKQADTLSKAGKELEIASILKTETGENESMTRIRLGPYGIGSTPKANLEKIKNSLLTIQKSIYHFQSFLNMREIYESREELVPEIREELATILLRRVLPGRCKYCPI